MELPRKVNLQDIGASFVLKMLSEQKLLKETLSAQFVVIEAATLIRECKAAYGWSCDRTARPKHTSCLANFLESFEDSFVSLHTQYTQNKYLLPLLW